MPLGWFAPLSAHTLVMPAGEALSADETREEMKECDILVSTFSFAVTADIMAEANISLFFIYVLLRLMSALYLIPALLFSGIRQNL